jgi:hypothetical protein
MNGRAGRATEYMRLVTHVSAYAGGHVIFLQKLFDTNFLQNVVRSAFDLQSLRNA